MRLSWAAMIVAVLASGAGCGGNGAKPSDDLGCASWQVALNADSNATAALVDGALVLRRPGLPQQHAISPFNGDDIAFSQTGLRGEFDVTVSWEDFQTGGGIWSRVEAGIWWNDPASGYITQATGEVQGSGGDAVLISPPADFLLNPVLGTPVSLDGASGSFRIARTAADTSVTTTINGRTATSRSTTAFPDQSYILFLGIGIGPSTSTTDLHNEASIRSAGVAVTGGDGTVRSDGFSCGTLNLAAGTLMP